MFSTAHKHLLVPRASAPHSAYRVGVAPQETPRHSWDVVGYVKYLSRTLTGCSQLCKECKVATAGERRLARTRRVHLYPVSSPDTTEPGTARPSTPLATSGHPVRRRRCATTARKGGRDGHLAAAWLHKRWREALRSRLAGAGSKPPAAAAVKSRCGKRAGQGRPKSLSGRDQADERK